MEGSLWTTSPHLLCQIYNNREIIIHDDLWKNVKDENGKQILNTGVVQWKVFEEIVNWQKDKQLKIAPHLKPEHIKLTSWSKMNVNPARSVLSRETATAIRFLVKHENKPQEWLTTAYFCETVEDWFNVMNNRKLSMAFTKNNKTAVENWTCFLEWFMVFFASIQFNKKQKGGLWKVQKGVLLSTISVLYLVEKLFDLGYRYVLTARFTNDCIGKKHALKNKIYLHLILAAFGDAFRLCNFTEFFRAIDRV